MARGFKTRTFERAWSWLYPLFRGMILILQHSSTLFRIFTKQKLYILICINWFLLPWWLMSLALLRKAHGMSSFLSEIVIIWNSWHYKTRNKTLPDLPHKRSGFTAMERATEEEAVGFPVPAKPSPPVLSQQYFLPANEWHSERGWKRPDSVHWGLNWLWQWCQKTFPNLRYSTMILNCVTPIVQLGYTHCPESRRFGFLTVPRIDPVSVSEKLGFFQLTCSSFYLAKWQRVKTDHWSQMPQQC